MKTLTQKTTTKAKTSNIQQLGRLKELKRQINDGHEATELFIKNAKDKSREALKEAILVGQALAEVKKIVQFGGFGRWLKENCKSMNERTVQRYMSLHNAFGGKTAHVTDLTPTSLRKAYIALGIITEASDQAVTSAPTPENAQSQPTANALPVKSSKVKPKTKQGEKAQAVAVPPVIQSGPSLSKTDKLSRINFLTGELLNDLFNKLSDSEITVDDLKAASLDPIQAWFDTHSKSA